jgi:hypothetical protein
MTTVYMYDPCESASAVSEGFPDPKVDGGEGNIILHSLGDRTLLWDINSLKSSDFNQACFQRGNWVSSSGYDQSCLLLNGASLGDV